MATIEDFQRIIYGDTVNNKKCMTVQEVITEVQNRPDYLELPMGLEKLALNRLFSVDYLYAQQFHGYFQVVGTLDKQGTSNLPQYRAEIINTQTNGVIRRYRDYMNTTIDVQYLGNVKVTSDCDDQFTAVISFNGVNKVKWSREELLAGTSGSYAQYKIGLIANYRKFTVSSSVSNPSQCGVSTDGGITYQALASGITYRTTQTLYFRSGDLKNITINGTDYTANASGIATVPYEDLLNSISTITKITKTITSTVDVALRQARGSMQMPFRVNGSLILTLDSDSGDPIGISEYVHFDANNRFDILDIGSDNYVRITYGAMVREFLSNSYFSFLPPSGDSHILVDMYASATPVDPPTPSEYDTVDFTIYNYADTEIEATSKYNSNTVTLSVLGDSNSLTLNYKGLTIHSVDQSVENLYVYLVDSRGIQHLITYGSSTTDLDVYLINYWNQISDGTYVYLGIQDHQL